LDREVARSLKLITWMLAFACGAAAANLYYAQPLLDLLASSFHVSQGTATIAVTATQIGYALGLAFVIPLGDLLENRALASRTMIVTAVALGLAAAAPNLAVFVAVAAVIGLTSVVAQILIPLAAHLAPEDQRGKFVGQVMSGLLLGILLARSVASLAADAAGWRTIYIVSAVLMLLTSIALRRVLPTRRPAHQGTYRSLLASVARLARDEPILRRRALTQAAMFGAFTAFWTGITYELIDEHHLSQVQIAVFALVAAVGALAAPVAGRLGDKGYGRAGRGIAMIVASAALVLAWLGHGQLVLLGLGGAVQVCMILSQRDIYALREDARARVNAVYMTTMFLGGAISSAVVGPLHTAYGWNGVAAFGAALPLLAFVGIWLTERAPRAENLRQAVSLSHTPN
jgi:predicted MFS family arabinose efflux permease